MPSLRCRAQPPESMTQLSQDPAEIQNSSQNLQRQPRSAAAFVFAGHYYHYYVQRPADTGLAHWPMNSYSGDAIQLQCTLAASKPKNDWHGWSMENGVVK